MFEGMEIELATTDQLEQQLVANEALRSRLAAVDLKVLEELDRRQVATGDGCRSLSEWVSSRVDVSIGTARERVRTMRRTSERPDLRQRLAAGDMSFDRVAELSKLPDGLGQLRHLDIGGVRAEVAKRVRVTGEDETRTGDDEFLVLQPTLDESWWKVWVGSTGIRERSSTRLFPRLPTSFPGCLRARRCRRAGGEPRPSGRSALPMRLRRLR